MIRVNLNVLLAERNLTASRLAKDTGISKTTLSSLVNNSGKGVQYDTIDTICNYLNVTPNEFFDYIPIDYSLTYFLNECDIKVRKTDKEVSYIYEINYKFDFFIDIYDAGKKSTYELTGDIGFIRPGRYLQNGFYVIELKPTNADNFVGFKKDFYDNISAGHRVLFDDQVEQFIIDNFNKDFKEKYKDSDNVPIEVLLKHIIVDVLPSWVISYE